MVTQQLVSSGAGIFAGIFAVIGVAGLFPLIFVIIVVANRAEPDPRGLRPHTVYLFGMSFVTLLLAFAGATMVVTSLLSFIGPHQFPIADGVASSVVIGGLFVLIAGGVLAHHLGRGLEIAQGDGRVDGPNARILHTYASVVMFIFVVVALISLGIAVYLVFQLIAPGIFGSMGGGRTGTLRVLLDLIYLMAASGFVVLVHSRFSPGAMERATPSGSGAPG
jgi:hypothetical protein